MKDVLHQALFLFVVVLCITGLRLLLGPWIPFLEATSVILYLVLTGILAIIVLVLLLLQRRN